MRDKGIQISVSIVVTVLLSMATALVATSYANGARDAKIEANAAEIQTLRAKMDRIMELTTESNTLLKEHLKQKI